MTLPEWLGGFKLSFVIPDGGVPESFLLADEDGDTDIPLDASALEQWITNERLKIQQLEEGIRLMRSWGGSRLARAAAYQAMDECDPFDIGEDYYRKASDETHKLEQLMLEWFKKDMASLMWPSALLGKSTQTE